MYITKKRVINPQRYLCTLHSGDRFYIAAKLSEADLIHLQRYGIVPDAPARVPIPVYSASNMNANGKWEILRTLPKETRSFVHAYHVVDWHGQDHYGTYIQYRQCYQRKLLSPAEIAFVIENGILYSPIFENCTESMDQIKLAMNVFLEMVGHFEILAENKTPSLPPVKQYEVPWEILRSGTRDSEAVVTYIARSVERKTKSQQAEIINRHKYLHHKSPDFIVLGTQNFFGYVVYGFPAMNLFIFESNEINNATYLFRGDWKEASKLTKTEILAGGVHKARVFHTEQWQDNLDQTIHQISKEVA